MSRRARTLRSAINHFQAFANVEFGPGEVQFTTAEGVEETGNLSAESMRNLWVSMTNAVIASLERDLAEDEAASATIN
jgi:hypothetical protein